MYSMIVSMHEAWPTVRTTFVPQYIDLKGTPWTFSVVLLYLSNLGPVHEIWYIVKAAFFPESMVLDGTSTVTSLSSVRIRYDMPLRQHSYLTRWFWRAVFDLDGIDLSPERRAFLDYRLKRGEMGLIGLQTEGRWEGWREPGLNHDYGLSQVYGLSQDYGLNHDCGVKGG